MERGVHAIKRTLESAGYTISVTPIGGGIVLGRLSLNGKTLHRAVGRMLCNVFLELAREAGVPCIHAGNDIRRAGVGPKTVSTARRRRRSE